VARIAELARAKQRTPRSWRWPGAGAGRGHRPHSRHQAGALSEENAAAAAIRLSPAELEALDAVFPQGAAAGERYAAGVAIVNR